MVLSRDGQEENSNRHQACGKLTPTLTWYQGRYREKYLNLKSSVWRTVELSNIQLLVELTFPPFYGKGEGGGEAVSESEFGLRV